MNAARPLSVALLRAARPIWVPARLTAQSFWLPGLRTVINAVWASSILVIAGSIAVSIGPRFAPYEAFVVLSGSMEPVIHAGSVEVVRPVPADTLRVGDIITYERVEEPLVAVTHRITQIAPSDGGPVLRTKGDVNEVEDPWEVQLRTTGWVHLLNVPYAGYLLVFAQSATGRLFMVVLPAGALAALWLFEIWSGRQ